MFGLYDQCRYMQDLDGGRKHRINVYAACSGGVVVVALGFLVTSGLEAFCKGLERSTQLFIMNLACTVTGVRYTRYRYPVTVSGVGNRYSNLGKFLRLEAVPLRGPVQRWRGAASCCRGHRRPAAVLAREPRAVIAQPKLLCISTPSSSLGEGRC